MGRFKHLALAALCGALATLSLAPFHLVFLLIPAFSGLFYLLWQAETKRRIWPAIIIGNLLWALQHRLVHAA